MSPHSIGACWVVRSAALAGHRFVSLRRGNQQGLRPFPRAGVRPRHRWIADRFWGRPDVAEPRPGRGVVREHLPWREGTLGCVSPGWTGSRRARSPRRTSGVVGRLEAATGRFHRSRATRDLPDESQHEPFGNRINSPGQATRKTHDLCFKLNQSLSGDRTPCAALLNQNISRRNRFASLLNQFVKSRQPACEAIVSARRSNARAGQFRSVQMTG